MVININVEDLFKDNIIQKEEVFSLDVSLPDDPNTGHLTTVDIPVDGMVVLASEEPDGTKVTVVSVVHVNTVVVQDGSMDVMGT